MLKSFYHLKHLVLENFIVLNSQLVLVEQFEILVLWASSLLLTLDTFEVPLEVWVSGSVRSHRLRLFHVVVLQCEHHLIHLSSFDTRGLAFQIQFNVFHSVRVKFAPQVHHHLEVLESFQV